MLFTMRDRQYHGSGKSNTCLIHCSFVIFQAIFTHTEIFDQEAFWKNHFLQKLWTFPACERKVIYSGYLLLLTVPHASDYALLKTQRQFFVIRNVTLASFSLNSSYCSFPCLTFNLNIHYVPYKCTDAYGTVHAHMNVCNQYVVNIYNTYKPLLLILCQHLP